MSRRLRLASILAGCLFACLAGLVVADAQGQAPRFGTAFSSLGARRQALVTDWVGRFEKVTGQKLEASAFYDEVLSLSTKTTFDAVTHALMTTPLTDAAGASLGDALGLIERVESARGEVAGARGDHQFRIYVRLTPDALAKLARSQQFKRGADNTVYHKGYPTNYRGQGVPSVQFSVALDNRRADIDVDYRSSSFPAGLFNGHLTSSNSDVRAGNNYDRHLNRWTGFQNWWQSFLGIGGQGAPKSAEPQSPLALPKTPRVGRVTVDTAINDFLNAWLVEGNIVAAMGSVSERAYACVAQDSDDPSNFDRGLAPFQLMVRMKSAQESLGVRKSLDGLVAGVPVGVAGLREVRQPHAAIFTEYSVPDDLAMAFDCESRLTPGKSKKAERKYGKYFGASFYVDGRRDLPVALLWTEEEGFWKIVSWKVGTIAATGPEAEAVAVPKVAHIKADPTLVEAGRNFLESWLIRKDYDAAFAHIAPQAYGCYDLERGPQAAPSTSPEDAGRKLRAGLEAAGKTFGTVTSLGSLLSAAQPIHPTTRVMDHSMSRVFSLSSPPNALVDAAECAARKALATIPDPVPLEYGNGYGMTVRFLTPDGDAPVLRLLWRKQGSDWRITSYGIETP